MQITLQKENLTRARTGNPIIPEKLGEQRIEQVLRHFIVEQRDQRFRLAAEIVVSKLSSAPTSVKRFRVMELNLKSTPNC